MGAPVKDYDEAKQKVLGTIDFLQAHDIPYTKSEVFRHFGLPPRQGRELLRYPEGKPKDPNHKETRGRKKIFTNQDVRKIENFVWEAGLAGRELNWPTLLHNAGIDADCSWRTIRGAIGTLQYRRCITCQTRFVCPSTAKRRLQDATKALSQRPSPESWRDIRFSSELRFAVGSDGQARLIRRPGERLCPQCVEGIGEQEPEPKLVKTLHVWAAIGSGFISDLSFYEVPQDPTGEIRQEMYRDEVLKKQVKPWIQVGHQFILEEDVELNIGKKNTTVKAWKDEQGLRSSFSTLGSPDMTPIEDALKVLRERLIQQPSWDIIELKRAANETWNSVQARPEQVDAWVYSMPQRMRDVIAVEGRMTMW